MKYDLEEDAWTLLMFDVVNLDRKISEELQKETDQFLKNNRRNVL